MEEKNIDETLKRVLKKEIIEFLELAEQNYKNGKYRNNQEKKDCYFVFYGQKNAYYNILKILKEL